MARINDWIMSLSKWEKLIAPSTEYTVRCTVAAGCAPEGEAAEAAAGAVLPGRADALASARLSRLVSIRFLEERGRGNPGWRRAAMLTGVVAA
ncbi:hypothetical protein P3F88_05915 [Paraburkholderia phenoliruptrix]|nr:hypothetical protein P3F88_05915 [Paraburkholderia phenoliruptrix]